MGDSFDWRDSYCATHAPLGGASGVVVSAIYCIMSRPSFNFAYFRCIAAAWSFHRRARVRAHSRKHCKGDAEAERQVDATLLAVNDAFGCGCVIAHLASGGVHPFARVRTTCKRSFRLLRCES